ncbi:MAG: hypothetical protein ACRBF0_09375 [Calditrichia bacterium]
MINYGIAIDALIPLLGGVFLLYQNKKLAINPLAGKNGFILPSDS